MKIRFSENELNFLKSTLFKEKINLDLTLIKEEMTNISDDFADEIRDWALEKQQVVGFDENYELTKEGKILENIIDKLCN
ncbi:hypothetical protein [Flavobacterium psychrophilum]|uniref:Uncharacterized protein n=1 Tax=Flavobacterium psychrophilum TaxID=96345 RepID=A0A7U2NF69_FLAPS|nr:hypothetical protein [Flavobacterium psychrophilum]OAE92256.1 hypothetical protein SU65_10925 [Flavobacterium psychrophilum]QRE04046.1 hypothetical protein H0H26_00070 [Flavobacterium psychrophilum]